MRVRVRVLCCRDWLGCTGLLGDSGTREEREREREREGGGGGAGGGGGGGAGMAL